MSRIKKNINCDRYIANLQAIHNILPPNTKLLPIIKANAYGHGLITIAKAASTLPFVSLLGIAYPEEIEQLNTTNIPTPRLLLSEPSSIENRLITPQTHFTVYSEDFIKHLQNIGKTNNIIIPVHLKIDTGMHRFGCTPQKADQLLSLITKASHLTLKGIYSHLSDSEQPDSPTTKNQLSVFESFITQLPTQKEPTMMHLCNSYGSQTLPKYHYDAVRIGLDSYDGVLEVTTTLKAIKTLPPNTELGYAPSFKAPHPTKYGIIETGYRDGLPTQASNKAYVLIKGQKAPIIGQICMDCCFVDLSKVPNPTPGDTVTILGQDNTESITPKDWHNTCDINPRELLINLGNISH